MTLSLGHQVASQKASTEIATSGGTRSAPRSAKGRHDTATPAERQRPAHSRVTRLAEGVISGPALTPIRSAANRSGDASSPAPARGSWAGCPPRSRRARPPGEPHQLDPGESVTGNIGQRGTQTMIVSKLHKKEQHSDTDDQLPWQQPPGEEVTSSDHACHEEYSCGNRGGKDHIEAEREGGTECAAKEQGFPLHQVTLEGRSKAPLTLLANTPLAVSYAFADQFRSVPAAHRSAELAARRNN
jgi:hypothetical protein